MRFIVASEDGALTYLEASSECNATDKNAARPLIRLLSTFTDGSAIQCMTFLLYPESSDQYLEAVAIACRDGSVCIIDIDDGELLLSIPRSRTTIEDLTNKANEDEKFVSIEYKHGVLATCTSSGHARFTSLSDDEPPVTKELELPAPVSVMRMDPEQPGVIAFGGKENDLQVWRCDQANTDLETLWSEFTPYWKGKNVKNDELDLRVPIWISDIQFLPSSSPGTSFSIMTSTRFHQIRTYETAKARRPIQSLELSQYPITQLLVHRVGRNLQFVTDVEVIFSDTQSNILHASIPKGIIIGSYKGASGAATSICLSEATAINVSEPDMDKLLVTGGMDGYMRAYHVIKHDLYCSAYIGSKVKSVLSLPAVPETKNENSEEEIEDVWHGIEEVEDDRTSKRRRKA